jgi:hypothetical protein
MAQGDHTDRRWDERVRRTLTSVEGSFRGPCDELATLGIPRGSDG